MPVASVEDGSLLLLYWASVTTTSGYLLGVESAGDSYAPIWICANFSLRTYVGSLNSNPKTASEIYSRWRSAFSSHASGSAKEYKVPVIVGSQAFTVPILAEEVLNSIIFAGIVSVSGFVGCILLFTWSLSVTAMGSLLIVEVAAITICIHQLVVPLAFDLLDVVVIVAIEGMLVDFPAHVILYIVHKRQRPSRIKATVARSGVAAIYSSENIANPNTSFAGADDISVTVSCSEDPVLESIFASKLLLMPTILIVSVSIPLCFATFVLLQKTGQYMIVMSLASYACSVILLPSLLLFTKNYNT